VKCYNLSDILNLTDAVLHSLTSTIYTYKRKIKKVRAVLEYFHCMIGNIAETWHTVPQGQAVTCCMCDSAVHLCQVSAMKMWLLH
jgi:hypothetical protein